MSSPAFTAAARAPYDAARPLLSRNQERSVQARRVLVTGAASGIGATIAERFRTAGDIVAGIDVDAELLRRADLDAARACDVSDEQRITEVVNDLAETLDGLEVLICSAGIAPRGSAADTTIETWDRTFAVNVRGVFLTARAALPHLRRSIGARIVLIASQLGVVGAPDSLAYCASKGAVIQLARAMALDHAADGINVNALCPGPTSTPLTERYFSEADDPDAEGRRFREAMPLGRLLDPSEIAGAAFYLASSEARGVTGSVLVVDGGYTAI